MVVFLRRGMKVWMDSWSTWVSEPVERPADQLDSGTVLLAKARNELTLVLAGMALCGSVLSYGGTGAPSATQGVTG